MPPLQGLKKEIPILSSYTELLILRDIMEEFTCVGHSVPRVDALDKVLGRAVYSEDMSFPNML